MERREIDWAPLIGGGIAAAAGIYSAVSAKREAEKNRAFQERMSSTSHQREVEDLKKAGLNPALSARLGGASTPAGSMADLSGYGEGGRQGVMTALAVQQMRANVKLTEANTAKTLSEKQYLDDSYQLRLREQGARTDFGELDAYRMRESLPTLIDQAKANVRQTAASARQMEALALLTELEKQGYTNMAEFEKRVGAMGPAGKYILEIMRTIAPRKAR